MIARRFGVLLLHIFLVAGCTAGPDRDLPEALQRLRASLPVSEGLNVVVISFDALRADALGTYGYPLKTSPQIDEFAQRALVFDRAYSAAPVTPTSFAAAFTGQLPHRVFRGWSLDSTRTIRSIGQVFSDAGYRTAAFLNNVQLTSERHFDQGFDEYVFHATDDVEVLNRSIEWISKLGEERFFLWIHFISPHSPYTFREVSNHIYDPEYKGEFGETTTNKFETDDANEIRRIRSLYDGEVFWADQIFGRLLEALEASGVLERSLLVLTSDHGEEFKERGGFQHRLLYEETIRIPLIVFHPRVSEGARTDILTSNVDLLPTLAALTALPGQDGLDGRSLLSAGSSPPIVISEAMTDSAYRGVALIEGSKKLIVTCHPELRMELYDLVADPHETRDLFDEQREEVYRLRRRLLDTFRTSPCDELQAAVRGQSETKNLSEETIEELKALGYID